MLFFNSISFNISWRWEEVDWFERGHQIPLIIIFHVISKRRNNTMTKQLRWISWLWRYWIGYHRHLNVHAVLVGHLWYGTYKQLRWKHKPSWTLSQSSSSVPSLQSICRSHFFDESMQLVPSHWNCVSVSQTSSSSMKIFGQKFNY